MKVLREGLLKLSISREIMPLLDLKGRAVSHLAHWPSSRGLARSCDIYVESDHTHTQHGYLELLYVVVYKTDKGGIAGTNNSYLLFAHKPF